jgi:hypothetical protein
MAIPSCDELRPYIHDFLELYARRPIRDNTGGMKSPHCFWTYYWLRKLQPEVVIESGVWKGQSTWLIEQTLPTARIISIDMTWKYLQYKSPRAEYTNVDFNTINWTKVLGNSVSKTLAFIDDHQNNYERLKTAYTHKIRWMIFEDNYPTSHGDVLSLKKILMGDRYILDTPQSKTWHVIPPEYRTNVLNVCTYTECPPVYLDTPTTRWGDSFAMHGCQPPLFSVCEPGMEPFKEEQLDYTFLAIVELKRS